MRAPIGGGSNAMRGLAAATSTFWLILDDAASNGNDQIVEADTSSPFTVRAIYDAPSDSIDGIAYANNNLFVLENTWHWSDYNEHRIYKFSGLWMGKKSFIKW